MNERDASPLSYRAAGVDIAAADALVARLRALARATHGKAVRHHTDAYAGLYTLPDGSLLAASCDGVGTKLLVARELGRYRGLGQDLVAMNVNDLLPSGATPLFFLDYLAAGRLDGEVLFELCAGMAEACRRIGCALLGGETAEMPGVYAPAEFDLAGFAVGLTSAERLPCPQKMAAGDQVLALPSVGVHANGFSLVRRALTRAGLSLHEKPAPLERTIGEELLLPTALYVKPVLAAFAAVAPEIRAAAHITGGGLVGRARAFLPAGLRLCLDPASHHRPPIFALIARAGDIALSEMAATFNMGLGFLLVVSPSGAERLLAAPASPWLAVGQLQAGERGVDLGYDRCE